jgi:hypothetical protein
MRTSDGRPFWTVEAERTFACMESHDWWQRHPGYLAKPRRRAEELARCYARSSCAGSAASRQGQMIH